MSKSTAVVQLVTHPGRRDELLEAFEAMMPAVAAEEGTEVYTVHADKGNENAVWVFELYRDDDALAEHSQSDAMKELLRSLAELLAEPPMMAFATPVHAKGIEL